MKQQWISTGLVLTALLLTGCDQDARDYAAGLSGLLDSMRKQATAKLLDEQERYQEFAHRQSAAAKEDELTNLRIDRTSGEARETVDQLIAGKIKGSEVMARLHEYAEKDITTTQGIFGSDPDAELDAIKELHDLSLDKAKLDALHEALQGLTKKQNLMDTATQVGGFGKEVKGNLDFHNCEALDKKASAEADKVKALQAKFAAAAAADQPAIQSE